MADLLDEMLDLAVSSKGSLAELLRRCLILSYKLGLDEFKQWAEKELNGYPDYKKLPEYRISQNPSYGIFLGPMGARIDNYPIPLAVVPEEHRDVIAGIYLRDSVGTIEKMIIIYHNEKNDNIIVKWPPEIIALVSKKIIKGYSLTDAWVSGSRSFIYEVLESVRNRILQFVLEVKKIVVTIDDVSSEDIDDIKKNAITNIFNITVLGDNRGNIAGSQKDVSVVINNVIPGDLESLHKRLAEIGMDDSQLKQLDAAIRKDGDKKIGKGFGRRVTGWLADTTSKIVSGVISNISIESVPLITNAIKDFFA